MIKLASLFVLQEKSSESKGFQQMFLKSTIESSMLQQKRKASPFWKTHEGRCPEESRCPKMSSPSSPSSPSCSFILARHLPSRRASRFDRSRWRCPRHCEGARLRKEPALCSSGMPEMSTLLDWHKFASHPSRFLL